MSPKNESVKKWDDISKSDEKEEEMYIYKLPKKVMYTSQVAAWKI